MKKLFFAIIISLCSFASIAQTQTNAQNPQKGKAPVSITINKQTVEISCGECKFKMAGKSCDLAVRINGKPYFVDGKSIDDFGDAHDEKHGFCNVIRTAEVTGEIVNNRFKATAITLLPNKSN